MGTLESILLVGVLLALVFSGVHVAVSLGIVSLIGLALATGDLQITFFFLNSTAYEALRDYVFAVVPLFMLMGEFISRSGIAADIFRAINRGLTRVPGRLAHATVTGNVVFAFVTGTSLASATAFTSIAYPQMRRYGYDTSFSLGLISGSACLGMLIPPSLLMIVWGILTEQSIGAIFLAGVLPGIVLAGLMILYIVAVSILRPSAVGEGGATASATSAAGAGPAPEEQGGSAWGAMLGLLVIVIGSLGGIWAGIFTPTEGAGIGALLALAIGVLRGLGLREIFDGILAVGKSAAPIMVILFAAQLYARTLAMSGLGSSIQGILVESGLGTWGVIAVMIAIWMLLGMIIDSISIIILTVPIFAPIALSLGLDPLAFAIIGILTIEAGLLTPPFGLLVYAVKSVAGSEEATLGAVFRGATPFWIILLVVVLILLAEPRVATVLTRLLL